MKIKKELNDLILMIEYVQDQANKTDHPERKQQLQDLVDSVKNLRKKLHQLLEQ